MGYIVDIWEDIGGFGRVNWLVPQDCQLPFQFLSDFQNSCFHEIAKVCIIYFTQKISYITQYQSLQS